MDLSIVTKFDVCLETKSECILHRSWVAYPLLAFLENPIFRISETAGRTALKFGLWLETHYLGVLKVNGGVQVHMRTCAPLLRISGNAGRIALKRVVFPEDH